MEIIGTTTCIEVAKTYCQVYFSTFTIPSISTSTLQEFFRLPTLIYVIGGMIIFFSVIIFLDFLRRTIR